MSIRFKFRSSVAFDSLDLEGRRSISVRDLRSKIVGQKKLQICKDFDLFISDAETGTAFEDDDAQIKEGSSVVIKRVPAGLSVPRDLDVGIIARKDRGFVERVANAPLKNAGKEDFDDFGVDLYPMLQESLPEFDAEFDNLKFTLNKKENVDPRCSETSISRCQNIERSDLSEVTSKEYNSKDIQKQNKLSKKEMQQKLGGYISAPLSAMIDMDLPMELRCSLCNAIFKNAVMIPCCQHSFCEKCIRLALVERKMCPKCGSIKCTVEALLPNLTLREAIEHFLETQASNNALENKIPQYAPDVESGIHGKEVSCAISIRKKEPPSPRLPSATGKGSNLVMAEAPYGTKLGSGTGKLNCLPLKMNQMKGGANSLSKLPQNFLQEEANMTAQNYKVHGVTVIDGSGTGMPWSRYRKGDRTCYMCGSPDHLIRDCPAASSSYQYGQTGDTAFGGGMPAYGQAYWHGNTFPQASPYANMYGTPGMMPFDPTMGPISPLSISPYMSAMYSGMPGPYGFTRMGGVQAPMTPGAERPLARQAFAEPQDGRWKHKAFDSHPEREHSFYQMPEGYYHKGPRRTHDQRHQETDRSFSDYESPRIHKKHSENKHHVPSYKHPTIQSDEDIHSDRRNERDSRQSVSGRDQRSRHSEKSNSECSKLSGERERHHHGERRGQYECVSRKSQHHEKDYKNHSHKHHNYSDHSLEPSFVNERRHHQKEKEASHTSSRSSRQMPKSKERNENERWEMVEGLDDEYRGVDHHKRRRVR